MQFKRGPRELCLLCWGARELWNQADPGLDTYSALPSSWSLKRSQSFLSLSFISRKTGVIIYTIIGGCNLTMLTGEKELGGCPAPSQILLVWAFLMPQIVPVERLLLGIRPCLQFLLRSLTPLSVMGSGMRSFSVTNTQAGLLDLILI